MVRLLFYSILSIGVILGSYLLNKAADYSEKENIIPKELRLMLLGEKSKKDLTTKQKETFIIGTSHVGRGFERCSEIWITRHLSGMSGARSIRIANAIMFNSLLEGAGEIDIVLEVTLLEEITAAQQKNSMVYQYLSDAVPVVSDLINRNRYERDDGCGEPEFNKTYREELDFSRALSEQLNDVDIHYLFSQYKYHLNKLVSGCSSTKNARITLVSFPVHSDLYAFPKVRNTFNALGSEMTAYLDSIQGRNSCDISYINLVELGAEFPEHKFWVDPGHFRPEVGERVLQEIELFHANKKPY